MGLKYALKGGVIKACNEILLIKNFRTNGVAPLSLGPYSHSQTRF